MHRMFHTPPFSNTSFDTKQSIMESYHVNENTAISNQAELKHSDIMGLNTSFSGLRLTVTDVSVKGDEVSAPISIPEELSRLIDQFVDDLKQPKYSKPLSILQLSHVFQRFYEEFERASQHHFNNNASGLNLDHIQPSRETKNSGLSSIFNRSRSSSFRSASNRSRSSTNSSKMFQPLLTPEEIAQQVRLQEENSVKIDQMMDLCETEVFNKVLQVGTDTPADEKRHHTGEKSSARNTATLFRNSPEFIEFDKLLYTKVNTLKALADSKILDLPRFLALDLKEDSLLESLEGEFKEFIDGSVSPNLKVKCLLSLHEKLLQLDNNNADEILPSLIYLLIINPRQELFLALHFTKLFRYHRRLKEKELYVTTNLEASISFIDSVLTKDLLEYCHDIDELEIPQMLVISDHVKLPLATNDLYRPGLKESYPLPDLVSVGNVIDSSLRNLVGRIKTYTPPPIPTSMQKKPQRLDHNDISSADWKRYSHHRFDDLTMSDMRNIFDIYLELANQTK